MKNFQIVINNGNKKLKIKIMTATGRLRPKRLWFGVSVQSLNFQISRLLRARNSLTFRLLQSVNSF